jgi:16S rRNA (guanine966-N2)-methyltransferase
LRIIAGKYRGRNLKSPASLEVRPTSDRLRETLFNVIAPLIEDARFLDLCAGSGALGIEALSRGASHATFVDRSRRLCSLIKANLDLCRVPVEQSEIVQAEATHYLGRVIAQPHGAFQPWNIVFFDPPYAENYISILATLGANPSSLLTDNGLLIVEHYHKNDLPDGVGGIIRTRKLKQGDSTLSFYKITG